MNKQDFNFDESINCAKLLDERDILKSFRKEFILGDKIYLNGNSLGPLCKDAKKRLKDVIDKEWGEKIIKGWNEGWFELPLTLGSYVERLLEAEKGTILVDNTTTVNMFKLIPGILKLQSPRKKIITDVFNFPTDFYVLQGIKKLLKDDYEIIYVKSRDDIGIDMDDIKAEMDYNTALIFLSSVAFKSGFLHNISEINRIAHKKGVLTLWDLSHSVGVVNHSLKQEDTDFAIGCTYKYLNGGPASPAFLYVKQKYIDKIDNSISGWFGHRSPFEFERDFRGSASIKKFLISSPPIISSASIEPALKLILKAGIKNIRVKSIKMTEYFIFLVKSQLVDYGFEIKSPQNYKNRGSHVTLSHPDGYRISSALRAENVIVDFRKPSFIRFAFAPLYNTFEEVYKCVSILKKIIDEKEYQKFEKIPKGVT